MTNDRFFCNQGKSAAPSPDISPAEQRLDRKRLKWLRKRKSFQSIARIHTVTGAVLGMLVRYPG
jgi:hypothetical protein